MTTAADVIAALNGKRTRQARLSLRPEVPGQLPPGWQRWFDGMPRVDAVSAGAKPQSWVEVLLQRPLRAIPRSPAMLNRWQAAASLLRQEWEPDSREERGLRIGVGVVDIVLHLVLVGLLLWLVYLGFMAAAEPQQEEDEAVQVEFIGRGNVAEGGGAIANAGAESAPAAAAPATRASTPAPATGSPEAPTETLATPSPPQATASNQSPPLQRESAPPAPAESAQVLQVTEVATPEAGVFQLPPPKPRDTPQPQLQIREVQPRQQVEEIATLQPQPQRTLQPREVRADVLVPQLREAPQAIDVPAPQRLVTPRALPTPATSTAQVQVPQLRGEVRDIPMPPGGAPVQSPQAGNGTAAQASTNAPGAGGERGNSPVAGQAQAGTAQGARPAEQGGRGVAATGSGAGPATLPAPGGWPGPAKTDDWGASRRNVAGTGNGRGRDGNGNPGLLNSDGSARLPDEWTQQSGIDVDRAGTWLKRPGLEYRGTRFDRYWIPQGTLLQEWVRRGVRKVSIPIPGSKVRLECVVSLLQLGGGCYPVNPDVNELPARARPPPDIPFKPELQEDNGSVQP